MYPNCADSIGVTRFFRKVHTAVSCYNYFRAVVCIPRANHSAKIHIRAELVSGSCRYIHVPTI